MLALIRCVRTAEVDHVLDRLGRRLPHVLGRVNRDTPIDQLLLDSLDLVELLCAIEQEFGVTLSPEMFGRAKTAADLATVIARRSIRQRTHDDALR